MNIGGSASTGDRAGASTPGTVGERIRRCRIAAGLTQADLATRAGVSVRAVRDIEHGRVQRPRTESLRRLTDAVGLTGADATVDESTEPSGLRVDVLGPLRVHRGSASLQVDSGQQRSLLGLLALYPVEPVTQDEIIDTLWGHEPPDSCLALVHTYVHRLRRLLGSSAPGEEASITRTGRGYQLRMGADGSDLARFLALVDRATAGDDDKSRLEELTTALELWRGPVLADLGPAVARHPRVVALNGQRVAVAVTFGALALRTGQAGRAVPELRAVAQHEPFHEQIHALLMLALAADGQQASALALHRDLRERLTSNLGVEPGSDVRDAHLRILHQNLPPSGPGPVRLVGTDSATAPAAQPPAQLPAGTPFFTGRTAEIAALNSMVPDVTIDIGTTVIAVITGMAGVGKTGLAMHWAHRAKHHFPDGQLYVDLRGYASGPPATAGAALAGFLYALGVRLGEVPADQAQAAALYRSLLADRRVLVLLDNAASAQVVRALLPGAPGSMVVVTSRDRLSGLVAVGGARRVPLEVLSRPEAAALLSRTIPADRVDADRTSIAVLAALCAQLPLALRIAAATIADHPTRSIAEHAAHLGVGSRLSKLEVDGDEQAAVRSAFDLSYTTLPESTRLLFRRLGTAPGHHITVPAAAELAGMDAAAATTELERLVANHLVRQPADGRYTVHDLLHLYAEDRAEAEDPPEVLRAARSRLYGWYLVHARDAADQAYRQFLRLASPPSAAPGSRDAFATSADALSWLNAEWANLVQIVDRAAGDADPAAWSLLDTVRSHYLHRFDSYADGIALGERVLAAAEAAGNPAGTAVTRHFLAGICLRAGNYESALVHADAMVTAAGHAGWEAGVASGHGSRGAALQRLGRLVEGAAALELSSAIHQRLGNIPQTWANFGNLRDIYREMGRVREAAEGWEWMRAHAPVNENRISAAITLSNLGESHHVLGYLDIAYGELTESRAVSRTIGYRRGVTESTRRLAAVHLDLDDLPTATVLATEALTQAATASDDDEQAMAATVLGAVLLAQGDRGGAIALHLRAVALARSVGRPATEAAALVALAAAYCQTDPALAVRTAGEAHDVASARGQRLLAAQSLTVRAQAHLAAGEPVSAARDARAALVGLRATDHLPGQARTAHLLVSIGAAGGLGAADRDMFRRQARHLSSAALARANDPGTVNADDTTEPRDADRSWLGAGR